MIIKRNVRFFEEPDDNGGGDPTDLLNEPATAHVEETVVEDEPEKDAKPAGGFDPAALASAFADSLKQAGLTQPPKAQEPAKLTPEEAKKLLNVWEPSDEFLQRFDNLDSKKAALAEMRDALIKQADTIVQLRMQELSGQFDQRLSPVQQFVEQQQVAAREARFNKLYPDLGKPELQPLLTAVVQGLAASGQLDPKDEAKTFKAIGTAMEGVIRQSNPNFKLTPAGSTPSGSTKKNGNALPATRSGAGGGGGGRGTDDAGAKRPAAMAFL